jgi:hypothetical protein
MARRPFFGQSDTKIAKMDMQAATESGRAYRDMFKSLGETFGGAIEKYQLDKEKQKKNEGFIKSQSSMLDMLAEQDPEMAPQYAAMKEQLNNPDVPLATRAEFGKNLVNNITLSTQLKGQKLLQDTQAQTLKEKTETEDLRKSLLQQKETYNNLGIELQELALTKRKELNAAEIKNLLAKYGFSNKQIEAGEKILPSKTDATMRNNEVDIAKGDIFLANMNLQGGPEGVAEDLEEDKDLRRRNLEADIRSKTSLADFRDLASQINVYNALNKASPSLAEQYKAEMNIQDELRKTKLRDPKEPGVELTYEEYLLKHEKNPTRYPLDGNNPAARLHGAILNSMRIQDELLKNKGPQVLANVPDSAPAPVQPGLDYDLQNQALMDAQSTGVTFPQLYR